MMEMGNNLYITFHYVCKGSILFDLVSYGDVRVQSNPFILKGDKRVLVDRAW